MKRNSFYLLLLTLAMSGLWSCSSDDSFDDYSKTTIEHKDVLNVDFLFLQRQEVIQEKLLMENV